ncbi:multicopper oxidase family protein [Arthrobacter sp. HLT1-21]
MDPNPAAINLNRPAINLNRRDALKIGVLTGSAVLFPFGNTALASHRNGGGGGSSPAFTPYTRRLPVPQPLVPQSSTASGDVYAITMGAGTAEILPGVSTPIWGYNGQYPGPLLRTRKGRQMVVHQTNNLLVPTSIHTHGAYVDGDSDGHPSDTIAPGATKTYTLGNNQNARTQWYHDHAEHISASNAYRGLAGFYLIDDALDDALPLPKGNYDVPIVVQDRRFNANGTLWYPANATVAATDAGFEGDVLVANGKAQPFAPVAARRYRFRFLNGSNARPYLLRLSNGQSFQLIATEGGLLEAPVTLTELPIWPAERYEVVIDFGRVPVGTSVYLDNGYGSGSVSRILRFDVVRAETDPSSVPAVLRPAADQADATHIATTAAASVLTRGWRFGKSWDGLYTINDKIYDKNRIDALPKTGDTEIWEFDNGWGWSHPVHMHLVNFKILDRNGQPPKAHERGWKDTVILNPRDKVRVLVKWPAVPIGPTPGAFLTRYAYHCHNLEHEDHDMMAQIRVV